MTTLALEFSSEHRSVAVVRDGEILAEVMHHGGRTTPVFSLIQDSLEKAGTPRAAIECIAVGLGPGSYAGIRRAIAVAQGWHLATGIKVAGVNSLQALAQTLMTEGLGDPCWLAVDAQRGEAVVVPAGAGKLTGPLRLVSFTELRLWVNQGQRLVTPDAQRIGEGVLGRFPAASEVGRIANMLGEWVAPETLAPCYLREVQFVKAPQKRGEILTGAEPWAGSLPPEGAK